MRENQQVQFRMANGRLHHQGLEWIAAGAVIRTSGSVAADETLDLVVELPIQEKWIGRAGPNSSWTAPLRYGKVTEHLCEQIV